jgi:hypothetical protein
MTPEMLIYPVAIIGITVIYTLWHRMRLSLMRGPNKVLRDRVTYMLWVAASRS